VADILTARGALAAAHAGTRLPGSSTACVLRLNRPHRTIDAANLVPSPPRVTPISGQAGEYGAQKRLQLYRELLWYCVADRPHTSGHWYTDRSLPDLA
jgi:hypothetical protein